MTITADGSFKPNLTYRVLNGLRSVGILLGGLGILITSLFVTRMYNDVRDDRREDKCRAEVATNLAVVQSDLNSAFVDVVAASFTHPRPDPANPRKLDPVVQAKFDEMNRILTKDLPKARDDRKNILDICEG